MDRKRIAVVGAGACGLAAIKTCLEYGLQPVCFEKTADIGGLWRYKDYECEGEASVMKSTVINTSKEMTAYSDFPPPAEFAVFMHNRQMLEYLRLYAEHFQLLSHIRFNTAVVDIRRSEDFVETGQWLLKCRTIDGGENVQHTFDGVMLASGHHVDKYLPPPFPGQSGFKGKIIHGHSYKHQRDYEDKNVVVVGVGNSGGDIAVELSRVAKQVYLSTRRGTWVFDRVYRHGKPADMTVDTRFHLWCNRYIPLYSSLLVSSYERELNRKFDHRHFGLKPAHRVFQAHPTVNDDIANRIASGTIKVKTNIRSFGDNRTVIFEDGTSAADIDAVLFCTGYSFSFPFLEGGQLITVTDNKVSLYKYTFCPELDHPTLAVIGLAQPWGSVIVIGEMQCRVFCDIFVGRSTLPSRPQMLQDIWRKRVAMAARYVRSRRHTIQVDYTPFMDELADLIGAKPTFRSYATVDWRLTWQLVFGPVLPYQYRLQGPHSWDGAVAALKGAESRRITATRARLTPETALVDDTGFSYFWLFAIAIGLFYYFFL